MAVLKRLKFAATSERFASTLAPGQRSLLEETVDADLAELGRELDGEHGSAGDKDKTERKTPKRTPLPPHLPRRDVAHEPTDTACQTPAAASRCSALARTWPRSWTTSLACSPSSAMCAASGHAAAAVNVGKVG